MSRLSDAQAQPQAQLALLLGDPGAATGLVMAAEEALAAEEEAWEARVQGGGRRSRRSGRKG